MPGGLLRGSLCKRVFGIEGGFFFKKSARLVGKKDQGHFFFFFYLARFQQPRP